MKWSSLVVLAAVLLSAQDALCTPVPGSHAQTAFHVHSGRRHQHEQDLQCMNDASSFTRAVRFDQHRLVRFLDAPRAIEALRRMEEATGEAVDVWGYIAQDSTAEAGKGTAAVDVRLSTEQLQRLLESTRVASHSNVNTMQSALRHVILQDDVQAAIDEETHRLRQSKCNRTLTTLNVQGKEWFEEYHEFEDIHKWYTIIILCEQRELNNTPHIIDISPVKS
jgi:hypothetical protein